MTNKLFLIMFAMIFLIGFGSAVNTLAPVKQNECINIIQTCATCTYNNISVIRYPNNGTYALNQDMVMTKSGISYNYTFCNTSQFGTYFVDGYGDLAGVKTGWGGFTFDVNGSGQTITQSQITLIIIGIVVLLILSAFFFILSFIFKHPGTKIFLMAMSTLILIVLIGLMASQFSIYLAEFAGLASFYDKFYILIVSFSSVAMVGLIVWLIWYSLKTFNKVRGRVPED